jgi:hypothetical protein
MGKEIKWREVKFQGMRNYENADNPILIGFTSSHFQIAFLFRLRQVNT